MPLNTLCAGGRTHGKLRLSPPEFRVMRGSRRPRTLRCNCQPCPKATRFPRKPHTTHCTSFRRILTRQEHKEKNLHFEVNELRLTRFLPTLANSPDAPPPPPSELSFIKGAPTSTVSPSFAICSIRVPALGARTSMLTWTGPTVNARKGRSRVEEKRRRGLSACTVPKRTELKGAT